MNTFDDVTLVVEGQKIECSKKRLAQHSEYFKIMFEGHFSERDQNTITMNDIDFESLRICIKMFENKSFIPEEDYLPKVLQTACMLQFEELIESVSDQLMNSINVDNCLNVWFLAEAFNLRPIYLKAKRMALVEFDAIKDKDALLKLDKRDLYKYLANVNLVCKEFDVFCAFMSWNFVNGNNIIELLAFLDFNRLSISEIADMLMYPDVRSSLALVNVLECIRPIRKGHSVRNDLAQKLLKCNRRGYWIEPLFFDAGESAVKGIMDENHKVADDDGQGFWKALILWMSQENVYLNAKYKIIGHKQQIYLFSGVHQDGIFSFTICIYDNVRKKWDKKPPVMMEHETFEMCINNNTVYIVGGGMQYRKTPWITDSRIMSVFKDDAWCYDILLPIWGGNAKCCNFNDQLFLFCNEKKCAYIYDPENSSFGELNIVEENFPKMEGEFAVYSCNDRIFLKDKTRLVQFRVESDELHVENVTSVPDEAYVFRDKSLLCHDTVYSIRRNDNLLTVEGEMICRDQDDYFIGTNSYVLDIDCKMLLPDDHTVSGEDKYVNSIENLFGN